MSDTYNNYRFSKDHEWIVKSEGNKFKLGISDYAQKALGDIVYLDIPGLNKKVKMGETIGTIESVKAVSDIFSPVSGMVESVNQSAINDPAIINQKPLDDGWILIMSDCNEEELNSLMSYNDYLKFISSL